MNDKSYTPGPNPFWVYFRTCAMLFPVLVAFAFSEVFLVPKLREVWAMAGIDHANAIYILDFATNIPVYTGFAAPPLVLILGVLESLVPGWRKVRAVFMDVLITLVYCVALTGVLAFAVCALLAVPVAIAKSKIPPPPDALLETPDPANE